MVGPFLAQALLALSNASAIALLCLGLALILVLLALAVRGPYGRLRWTLRIVASCLCRLRLHGRERLPRQGPALLVCNPVTFLDWLYLIILLPRQTTLVLPAPGYGKGTWARAYLEWAGALALDESGDAAAVEAVYAAARAKLSAGGLVCVFAQGWRLPSGEEFPASRTLRALAGPNVPILPLCFEQEWGSLWHKQAGIWHWRWPTFLSDTVELTLGEPLPGTTPPGEVLVAVHRLGAECDVARNKDRPPAHRRFVRLAARQHSRSCLIDGTDPDPSKQRTYGQTLVGAMCVTQVLRPILGDERMVGLWLPPSPGALVANVALAFLGKTSVNLNYTTGTDGIHSAIRQCGIRHVLTSRRFVERLKLDLPPGVEPIYLEDVREKVTRWMQLRNYLLIRVLPIFVLEHYVLGLGRHTNDDLATVIFSSGSTGDPKGVMLTHGNIAANIESAVHGLHLDQYDRLLGVLPMFHSFGYTITLWAPLNVGASIVYYPDPRAAREIGDLCKKYQCTVFLSTATFLRFCLKKCDPDAFQSLRVLICGAEKLPVALQTEFLKKFNIPAMEGYGCTELSPAAAANMPDLGHGGLMLIGNRPGTIGPPLPGCAARIVDSNTLAPVPLGEEGLVLVYGANVMRGYLGREDLTAKVKLEGWYWTGDRGKIDEEGHLTLTGRESRFAKTGGEMVPLERVEEELHALVETNGERVCVVTCVPDEIRGERIVVLYLSTASVDVPSWCKRLAQRGLPALWLPAERDFHAVPELPTLGTGKLDLRGVTELARSLAQRR